MMGIQRMAAIFLLFAVASCSNESTPTGAGGQVSLQTAAGGLAAVVSGQRATLDIVGVREGIPMGLDGTGNVSASVPGLPPGTWPFRITYYGSNPGQEEVTVAQAEGTATVVANTNTFVDLRALTYDFDEDSDGATNLQEVLPHIRTDPNKASEFPKLPVSVIAGSSYSLIVLNDGTAWSWGGPAPIDPSKCKTPPDTCPLGRLGDSARPLNVIDGDTSPCCPILTGVTAVAAGYRHALALKKESALPLSLWGWGNNSENQLCQKPQSANFPKDKNIADETTDFPNYWSFARDLIQNDLIDLKAYLKNLKVEDKDKKYSKHFPQAVAAGQKHSLAIKNDRTVIQCGPVPGSATKVAGLSDIISVAVGHDLKDPKMSNQGTSHNLALKKDDGTVWAWGSNTQGELGDGTFVSRSVPLPVKGPGGAGQLTGIVAVAAGEHYSLALASDGTVWHWGSMNKRYSNDVPTLPNPANPVITEQTTPKQVTGLPLVTVIAAGRQHALALGNDGSVWAWGDNNYGQLGDGSSASTAFKFREAPLQVQDLDHIVDVAAGYGHSLALKNDGSLWAWGRNNLGQLGIASAELNDFPRRSVPVAINVDFLGP